MSESKAVVVEVEMLAFMNGEVREVEVPAEEFLAAPAGHACRADLVVYHGRVDSRQSRRGMKPVLTRSGPGQSACAECLPENVRLTTQFNPGDGRLAYFVPDWPGTWERYDELKAGTFPTVLVCTSGGDR
jgi:hypothetical protein